jgi:hypothetical protein
MTAIDTGTVEGFPSMARMTSGSFTAIPLLVPNAEQAAQDDQFA